MELEATISMSIAISNIYSYCIANSNQPLCHNNPFIFLRKVVQELKKSLDGNLFSVFDDLIKLLGSMKHGYFGNEVLSRDEALDNFDYKDGSITSQLKTICQTYEGFPHLEENVTRHIANILTALTLSQDVNTEINGVD